MSDTIKVGFIGAGGNARGHMNSLKANAPEAVITAVCDVAADRAQEAAQMFNARPYTDYREMLAREKLDALYISITPDAHGEVEIAAAEKGLHFLVEKPVALTMETVRKVAPVVEKAGIITSVGYQLRYMPTSRAAKGFLAGKTIGMVQGRYWGGMPMTPWWRKVAISGGQMIEQATHCVDLIRFFVGEVKQVYARHALRTMHDIEGVDVPDAYVMAVEFKSGAIGTISSTCMLNTGGGSGGTDIEVIVRDARLHWNASGAEVVPESAGILDTSSSPAQNIDRVFIEAVRTGDRSNILSDYCDGARSFAVTLAAFQSAESGAPVEVGDW